MMNVLVACEESQAVCKAFREKGHNAFSCDIQECSGGHPEWHIQGDVLPLINGNCEFTTVDGAKHVIDGKWDLLIAHPPCTYLTVAANKLYNVEKYGEKALKRLQDREKALEFFMAFVNAECDKKAIENPIGVISTRYRKPTQIIQPYEYGHPVRKSTCLWLYNLPKLTPTNIVEYETIHSKGASGGYSGNSWVVKDENGKILSYRDPRVAKARSKTFPGIAQAMAEQWGDSI
jgi:site-specific DNA-cytosine methylase